MRLGELIEILEAADPQLVVRHGFSTPHSDRGDYADLAFTPAENVTVASMLEHARSAKGSTFGGYKGGEYLMDARTEVYLGEYGECGEPVSRAGLDAMLNMARLEAALLRIVQFHVPALQRDSAEADKVYCHAMGIRAEVIRALPGRRL